ncbi:hypothetical protein ACHAW5_006368 [Stephanodiscus triporus]|uniref:Uncharacterized protein n=1 Tax=Stephanodiscus triporus TaxID=2934178 RepID=A0ABD3ME13_9STRA
MISIDATRDHPPCRYPALPSSAGYNGPDDDTHLSPSPHHQLGKIRG